MLRFEFALGPRSAIPGTHTHPRSEQRISVSAGELHLRVGGRHRVVRPGESISVPPGTPHFQWNPGDTPVQAIEEYRPAGRLHDMFATFFRLAGEGMLGRRGRVVAPLLVAAFFAEFRDDVRASPRPAQSGLDLLAPLARLCGRHRAVQRARTTARARGAG